MPLSHYQKLYEYMAANPITEWAQEKRGQAWQEALQHGLPHSKLEAWKYTRTHQFTELRPEFYSTFPSQPANHLTLNFSDALQIVFMNGQLLSRPLDLPPEISLHSLRLVLQDQSLCSSLGLTAHFDQLLSHDGDVFSALNSALWQDGFVLVVQPGFELKTPIHCIYLTNENSNDALIALRNFVLLGHDAKLTLIEQYENDANEFSIQINSANEIFLQPNACLTHLKVGLEPINSYHIDNTRVALAKASHYMGYSLALTQGWSRTDWRVALNAPHACATMNGLFFSQQKQFTDHQITMHHQHHDTQSKQSFFGMVDDQAKAVCNGRVIVAAQAHNTQAQQTSKNILLSPQAEIFTKPELQIYNQDVQCQHGATVGQLDLDALFYLQSRGLSFNTARQLMLNGFAAQFTATLPDSLRTPIEQCLQQHLSSQSTTEEIMC